MEAKILILVTCNRRLYEQSTHLHAKHDEGLIKKANGINAQEILLSEKVMLRLQAGAFLSLCQHLRTRSDEVRNIDLMTISGFCRNCLAKVCSCLVACIT